MIKRIVKMSFDPEKVELFKKVYERNWNSIKNFEGCRHVELLQVAETPNIFFTYSIWESTAALENYRGSALFSEIWSATKIHFNDKPQAWTVNELMF